MAGYPTEEEPRTLLATEAELQRLILDIHDGPVQKLFVAAAQLRSLQDRLEQCPPELRDDLLRTVSRLDTLIQSALHEIRSTICALRPVELQRRSLAMLVREAAVQHEAGTGNQVDMTIVEPIPPVGAAVKIALYRVVQEALSNAYRHAGVNRHTVRLRADAESIELEVIDDGCGFEMLAPDAGQPAAGLGLSGMRERLRLIGGEYRIESRPGQGTRVLVRVPVDADQ